LLQSDKGMIVKSVPSLRSSPP